MLNIAEPSFTMCTVLERTNELDILEYTTSIWLARNSLISQNVFVAL